MKQIIRSYTNGALLDITVKPDSNHRRVKVSRKNGVVVSVVNPPVKGRANREVEELFSRLLGKRVSIHKCDKNYHKTIFVPDVGPDELKRMLDILSNRHTA